MTKVDGARLRARRANLEARAADFLRSAEESIDHARSARLEAFSPPVRALWQYAFDACSELLPEVRALSPGSEGRWVACANLDSAASRVEASSHSGEFTAVPLIGQALWLAGNVKGQMAQAELAASRGGRGGRKPRNEGSKASQARALHQAERLGPTKIASILDMDPSNVRKALRVKVRR